MKQTIKVYKPVMSQADRDVIASVGGAVALVLRDGTTTTVYLTEISDDGKTISWDRDGTQIDAAKTRSQNATTAASDDTTGDALANALKTSYNAAQVDIATLFRSQGGLGSPTSSQNATTAASSDGTRLALANALKANYNAAQVDVAEIFTANPELGSPTSSQLATADGSDDATTQTLLNALKTAYNALQADIAEAFSKLDTNLYCPRADEVLSIDGQNIQPLGDDTDIHDGIGEDEVPRVPSV